METRPRLPLKDLPLDQFTSPSLTANKSPRKTKRPLSPSRTTPLNPAKRRVLDAEGVPLSNVVANSSPSRPVPFLLYNLHTVTPTRPSRLGNGLVRNRASPHATMSPLSAPALRSSPPRELFPKPAIDSSVNPQSRHYPGFDICPDSQPSQHPSALGVSPLPDGDSPPEEDKENLPLRRKTKKPLSKKRIAIGIADSESSCLCTPTQRSEAVPTARTPLSDRQTLR